jgi:Na+/proline symporter
LCPQPGAAELIDVSSLVAYDIYREYIYPEATGAQILFVSRVVAVAFGLVMGAFSIRPSRENPLLSDLI